MDTNREECRGRMLRFRPRLEGCVARDRHFANLLEGCYVDAFSSVAANIYRSLVVQTEDAALSELYDEVAEEELETFRLLGELIMALGGDATLCRVRRMRSSCGQNSFLRECCSERMRNVDRYESLMGGTDDRVVRSVMAKLLASERRLLEKLRQKGGEKDC